MCLNPIFVCVVEQVCCSLWSQMQHRPSTLHLDLVDQRLCHIIGTNDQRGIHRSNVLSSGPFVWTWRRTISIARGLTRRWILLLLLLLLWVDHLVGLEELIQPHLKFLANLGMVFPLPHNGSGKKQRLVLDHLTGCNLGDGQVELLL